VQDSLAAAIPFPKLLGKPEQYADLAVHIVEGEPARGDHQVAAQALAPTGAGAKPRIAHLARDAEAGLDEAAGEERVQLELALGVEPAHRLREIRLRRRPRERARERLVNLVEEQPQRRTRGYRPSRRMVMNDADATRRLWTIPVAQPRAS